MDSWSGHEVPRLPGAGQPLALFDSARRGVHPTRPDGEATMYVCGITPYDATHLGHAAT
jgi:L-cysteine:1D-myo-inositol 2-amino-2-deoxy-alpha-D-glucopyranoside ligase